MPSNQFRIVNVVEQVVPGKRLGRHIEHDPASLLYTAGATAVPVESVRWERKVPVFDQGDLGSCTGNAIAGMLMTEPWYDSVRRLIQHDLAEQDAVTMYEQATHLDRIPGSYPPDDTGSSALGVMKAAREDRYITSYTHAFSLGGALRALQAHPGITGVPWMDTFDEPESDGRCRLTPASQARGGHELCLVGCDVEAQQVWFCNSWGEDWGLKGFAYWSYEDYDAILHMQGDVTFARL